jgi:hypothetical protein
MPTIVVSGHARKVGKTSVITSLIASFSEYAWIALKLSTHWHLQTASTEDCIIYEEKSYEKDSDSSRYLAAGAHRSFWVQVKKHKMASALRQLQPILHSSPWVIIEGNNVLDYAHADIHIIVLNYSIGEFKESARPLLERPDVLLVINPLSSQASWPGISLNVSHGGALFIAEDLHNLPPAFWELIRSRLSSLHPS